MKKIKAVVTLQIPAGKANPAPPVGPALAQHGINLMQFCKDYNARTASQVGNIIPAEVTVKKGATKVKGLLRTPRAAAPDKPTKQPDKPPDKPPAVDGYKASPYGN